MHTYRMRLFRFTRTASCHNFTMPADVARLDAIRRKAARHETLRHTGGTLATFPTL